MSQENITALTDITRELLDHLEVKLDDLQVSPDPDNPDSYTIQLNLPQAESGILIGYHAETLSSLQFILSLMIHQRLQSWYRLTVNINDYRQTREATLAEMAHNAAQRVRLTGQEVIMPYLESYERRLIHLALSEDPDLETVSLGEGRDRRLSIRPKSTQTKDERRNSND